MRDYAQLKPRFWVQGTGKALRKDRDARMLAIYLCSAPTSNLIGLYYLPVNTIAYDLGLSQSEAWGALARVCETGFAKYDDETEYVWVVNMAREQVGDDPKRQDKRVAGVKNELRKHTKSVFYDAFVDHYGPLFRIDARKPSTPCEGVAAAVDTPSEGVATPARTPSISGAGTGAGAGAGERAGAAAAATEPVSPLGARLAPVFEALTDLGYPTSEADIRPADLDAWRRIAGALEAAGGRRDVSAGSATVHSLARASCADHVTRHGKVKIRFLLQDFVTSFPPDIERQPAETATPKTVGHDW